MTTAALIAAITLVHAATAQECTFGTDDEARNFLKNVEDPDSWNEKQPESGANVVIHADNLTDAVAALDDLVNPVANIEPSTVEPTVDTTAAKTTTRKKASAT